MLLGDLKSLLIKNVQAVFLHLILIIREVMHQIKVIKMAFFLQLDTNGTRRFGAFYGGGNSDYFTGIDVLKSGRIAIVGTTQSPNLAKNFSSGYGSQLIGYNQTTNTTNSDILFMVLSNANILQTVRYLGGK